MNERFSSHLFWGSHSPLSTLTGAALIIITSSRFGFALICAGALLWVYGLTALVFSAARNVMPGRGRMLVLLFLAAFFSGIFVLLASLSNPLLIFGAGFFLLLIPPCLLGSGFFEASESQSTLETVSRALLEAMVLSVIILGLALIREPLGMGTLSVPGGSQGLTEIFQFANNGFLPVRILSVSAGGFLLFGYGTALFRYLKERL